LLDSVQSATRRTSKRSISVPTKSPSTVTGSSCISASAPTATAESVSCRTSQDAAICCTHVPVNETAWPKK
jgi:hypothetical protein